MSLRSFVLTGTERRAIDPLASCSTGVVTPACIQSLYRIPTTMATQSTNRLAVSGFDDQFVNQEDLTVRTMLNVQARETLTIVLAGIPEEIPTRPRGRDLRSSDP